MKRTHLLLTVILSVVLMGCTTLSPARKAPEVSPPQAPQPPSPPVADAPRSEKTPDPQPSDSPPSVERQPGHLIVRAAGGVAQAAIAPGAQQVAVLYGIGDRQQPTYALGILPLQTDGSMHQLTRFPAAGVTIPFPMLVGWLDDHRAVVVIGSLNPDGPGTLDGPAMRAEVWDTTSQQRTSASAWVPLAGKGMMGSPQAWLAGSGDSARVVLKTGSLWRLDPVGGQVEQVVEDLPAIKNLGSFVTASPDRWHALYGGGMNQARHGVADLRTGHELPLPEAWRRVVWGGTGHLLALTNTEAHPGQVLTGYDGAWDFYGIVVVASADGKVQRQLPLPTGLLAANAHETAEGWVIVESVRLTKDPTEKEFGYRVENGPLMGASPTNTALYPLWDWPGKYAPGSPIPWFLAGNWLLVDQKQLPLAGGQSIPLPDGVRSVIPQPGEPTQPPGNPLVVGSGSQLSLFLAGQTEARPMGSAYEEKVLQLDRTGNWAAVRFYGANAMAELHLVQVAP